MKSRTSFFNLMALKKDILRFAPVWGLYTIFVLLVLFLYTSEQHSAILARDIAGIMENMGFLNLVYAGICSVFLFGDLYNGRMCNALHAMPVRREGWFAIHVCSGILFALVPNLLATGLACFLLKEFAYMALLWLALSMLQYLFFFGTAALSAVCAGNKLGMAAVYSIIQFIMVPIYAMAELVYRPLLYGIRLSQEDFWQFMPVYRMCEREYVNFEYSYATVSGVFHGVYAERWSYLGLCLLVGLIALGLALAVYRKRNLEYAGDFIALKPLGPIFLGIFTICAGLLLFAFSEIFSGENSTFFFIIGGTIGFFTGLMLLKRTVKVFTKKAFIGFAAMVAILAGSMGLTWLDPAGITTYIPDSEDVAWAAFYSDDDAYLYRDDSRWLRYEITDPAEVEKLQHLHKRLAEERFRNPEDQPHCDVQVLYVLKDGSRVTRYYTLPMNTELWQEAGKRFSDIRYIFATDDIDLLVQQTEDMDIQSNWAKYEDDLALTAVDWIKVEDPEQIRGFFEAFQKDCAEFNTAQTWSYHEEELMLYYANYLIDPGDEDNQKMNWQERKEIRIYESCTHTVEYLEMLFAQYPEKE